MLFVDPTIILARWCLDPDIWNRCVFEPEYDNLVFHRFTSGVWFQKVYNEYKARHAGVPQKILIIIFENDKTNVFKDGMNNFEKNL